MTYGPEQWDQDADQDRWITDETGAVIRDRLDDLGAVTVLEVGCAVGRMTEILLGSRNRAKRRIVATDQSAEMIEEAQRRRTLPNVIWTNNDLTQIDGPFDAIVCSLLLHEIDEPMHLVEWLGGLLRPGGRMFVTMPSAKSLHHGGKPLMGDRAERFGVRRLWTPRHWCDALGTVTGLRVVGQMEMMLKMWPNSAMQCLSPEVLTFLAGYRGPGGAICFFELEAL